MDSVNRTLSAYWKTGAALNITTVTYFDKKGKIKFRESTRREVMTINEESKLVTQTTKTNGKKTLKITKDTATFTGW